MRYTRLHVPTLREAPGEAETKSNKLMLRAGLMRKFSPGEYAFLPVGSFISNRLVKAVEKELGNDEANSTVYPRTRIKICDDSADNMINFTLLKAITDDINSYKALPKSFYTKVNYEVEAVRPRLGLLKTKVYNGLDGFTLVTADEVENTYDSILKGLCGLFKKFNLQLAMADAYTNSEDKKGKVIYTWNEAGDAVACQCESCGKLQTDYSTECNKEYAVSDEELLPMVDVHTPNVGTVEEITAFLNTDCKRIVKTLLYVADGNLVAALLRGDRGLSEAKLKKALGCNSLSMADDATVQAATHAVCGYAGPVGLEATIVGDPEIINLRNIIVGANRSDYHKENVNINRDFKVDMVADIKTSDEGTRCNCGGKLTKKRGFTLGRIDILDGTFAKKAAYTYTNAQGKPDNICAVYYHINLDCLLNEIIEVSGTETGINLPEELVPFEVAVMAVKAKDAQQMSLAVEIYDELRSKGFLTVLDDRNESPGIRFKDLDLLGVPTQIVVGRRAGEGIVEVKRTGSETVEMTRAEAMNEILN